MLAQGCRRPTRAEQFFSYLTTPLSPTTPGTVSTPRMQRPSVFILIDAPVSGHPGDLRRLRMQRPRMQRPRTLPLSS